jgi:hypothetical protein
MTCIIRTSVLPCRGWIQQSIPIPQCPAATGCEENAFKTSIRYEGEVVVVVEGSSFREFDFCFDVWNVPITL